MPLYKRKAYMYKGQKHYKYKKRPRHMYARRSYNKAYKLARYAVSMLNTEMKKIDETASVTYNTAGTFRLLNGSIRGNSDDNRIGTQIRVKNCYLRLKFNKNASATATQIRYILFIDTQSNGASPTVANLLEVAASPMISPLNTDNGKRFNVILDRVVNLNTDRPEAFRKHFLKPDFKTEYNSGSVGNITDISTNALQLLIISDEATNTPTVGSYSRIRFVDN